MIMAGKVTFTGEGPFDLPVAQQARCDPGSDAVTLVFRVLVDPSRVELVRIAVLNNQALDLAGEIAQAAATGSSGVDGSA
jgi:hypothetical protein